MSAADMEHTITEAWKTPGNITPRTEGAVRNAILLAMKMLDSGKMRVAEQGTTHEWRVNEWLKKAILAYFKMHREQEIKGGPDETLWWDKVPNKFQNWNNHKFLEKKFRTVPGSIVRYSAFIGEKVVLMPCFVNVGAYIDEGTMIDTWSTIGSCAQIGKNCHISGGVGIGGVLEPLQAAPVIIEDNVFVGARSEIAEGVLIEKGAVISMGVFIGASTKIIDRNTGEIFYGRVPAYSVVVPGTLPGKPLPDGSPGPHLSCAVIVKKVDEQTRSKTSINEILRD
ncbi:MAG: 2,3,4,5-tetrahydropyridine-2,6-dicarboxylate N-succinyltransferase [Alphaproteobacteria bacterium CG_4_9_14_3_um_filter_47_13]|nr:MAG: 2,3,4,5-tetrahydropyridine-2,6-dicarboxylate N-succinyltransferase [Alphaproteobacteria bacterium CG_4_9_14_3_um_filter_47_13]